MKLTLQQGDENAMAPRQVATSHPKDSKQKRQRIPRTVRVTMRAGAEAARRTVPNELDCMENDYYRFLKHPRD